MPLQWMLGLQRLKLSAVWLEFLPSSGDAAEDERRIRNFQREMRKHRLRYCLLYQSTPAGPHDLAGMKCFGLKREKLLELAAADSVLLNLSYSIHPPLLNLFQRRILCDLDPSEIFYWMTKLEMGQSSHDEFWTLGLNVVRPECRLREFLPAGRKEPLVWNTFYPLADTGFYLPQPAPRRIKFTTIGQWYWGGAVEVEGEFPDLSKKHAFEQYLALPGKFPDVTFELAMNLNADDPEIPRLEKLGWRVVSPHRVASSPGKYREYLARASGEFTAIKGVDVAWQTGWLSDRAAAFLASGRPVVTEDTGAAAYLPERSAFRFVHDATSAAAAIEEITRDWPRWSKIARDDAAEVFDSVKNLRKILGL